MSTAYQTSGFEYMIVEYVSFCICPTIQYIVGVNGVSQCSGSSFIKCEMEVVRPFGGSPSKGFQFRRQNAYTKRLIPKSVRTIKLPSPSRSVLVGEIEVRLVENVRQSAPG